MLYVMVFWCLHLHSVWMEVRYRIRSGSHHKPAQGQAGVNWRSISNQLWIKIADQQSHHQHSGMSFVNVTFHDRLCISEFYKFAFPHCLQEFQSPIDTTWSTIVYSLACWFFQVGYPMTPTFV